jgi:hypothetical protein
VCFGGGYTHSKSGWAVLTDPQFFRTAPEYKFSPYVEHPPSIAQGGRGVVVPGKKRIGTMPQFLDHLTDDVLPALLDSLRSS